MTLSIKFLKTFTDVVTVFFFCLGPEVPKDLPLELDDDSVNSTEEDASSAARDI